MRNIKISLAALFLLLGLAACDKTPPYVAGRVLEAGTDKPIADARIFLTGCTGRLFGSLDCKVVDSTRTAEDGTYRINHITPELADLVTAVAPGYFSDLNSQASVPGDEFNPNINVTLYPHAWIRVKIVNESGAWGFFPDREESWYPALQLAKGESRILSYSRDFRKGNTNTKYHFSPYLAPNAGTPPLEYWTQHVKVFVSGRQLEVNVGVGASVEFYLPGHDTTDVTIIY
jgi:hypothetical protein